MTIVDDILPYFNSRFWYFTITLNSTLSRLNNKTANVISESWMSANRFRSSCDEDKVKGVNLHPIKINRKFEQISELWFI